MFKAFGEINEFKIEIKEVIGKFCDNRDFYIEAEKMIHVQPCNAYNFVLKDKTRIDKKKLKKFKIKEGKHLSDLHKKSHMVYNGKKYRSKQLTYIEPGKKVSFVLDTLFNSKIVPFVAAADALVCETSFDSSLGRLAKEYKHLTAKQVGEIAKKAKVRKLFLVHLSQRYSKNPGKILKEVKKIFKNASIPEDLDSVAI